MFTGHEMSKVIGGVENRKGDRPIRLDADGTRENSDGTWEEE